MEKLSQDLIDALKNDWYSRQEILWIQEGIGDINEWRVYSEEEMADFVENKLFAKYKEANV